MKVYLLKRTRFLSVPRGKVFDFFSRPGNLVRLTPARLRFRILTPDPIVMGKGTLIDYLLKIAGLPVRWTTLVTEYDPPFQFADVQIRGPYAFWHHIHRFEQVPGGTRVTDEVRYSLGFGIAGRVMHALLVQRQLKAVFDYRAHAMEKLIKDRTFHKKSSEYETRNERKEPAMKIVLSGATGFIGSRLVEELLKEGHKLVVLTRHPDEKSGKPGLRYVGWDGKTAGDWCGELDGADAVVNLAGASIVDKRWTAKRKELIRNSRIDSTRAIVRALEKAQPRPPVLVNASAVGYYGNVPEGDVTESSEVGGGFLAEVCRAWESEALQARKYGIRVALMRTGVVLDEGGGALEKMIPPFRFFAGGPLGSGKQWFPWVHRDDVAGAVIHVLKDRNIDGPFNATAPEPVQMKEFCRVLGRVMERPCWAPVPGMALRILVGEMANEMLLSGQKAVPDQLRRCGYVFRYPELEQALNRILGD